MHHNLPHYKKKKKSINYWKYYKEIVAYQIDWSLVQFLSSF